MHTWYFLNANNGRADWKCSMHGEVISLPSWWGRPPPLCPILDALKVK